MGKLIAILMWAPILLALMMLNDPGATTAHVYITTGLFFASVWFFFTIVAIVVGELDDYFNCR